MHRTALLEEITLTERAVLDRLEAARQCVTNTGESLTHQQVCAVQIMLRSLVRISELVKEQVDDYCPPDRTPPKRSSP